MTMTCAEANAITTADIARFTGEFEKRALTEAEVEEAWKVEKAHHFGFCPCETS